MKVHGHDEAAPARPPDKEGFRRALTGAPAAKAQRPAPTPPRPGTSRPGNAPGTAPRTAGPTAVAPQPRAAAGPVHLTPRGAFASPEHLGQVRQSLNSEAHRLKDVRGESLQVNRERVDQRAAELVTRELARELHLEAAPRAPSPRPAAPEPAPPSGEALSTLGEARGGVQAGGAPPAAEAPASEARAQAALALIEKIDVFMKSQRPALALRLGGALEATVEVERTGAREVALRIQGHRGPVPAGQLEHIREALASRGLRLSRLLAS